MRTAREMLKDHQLKFWAAGNNADCDCWMAKDAQLKAHSIRQSLQDFPTRLQSAAFSHDAYARQIMGITDADQIYA